jgi:hypothetical protein
MKPSHLDHMPKMVAKFEEEQGHELGWKGHIRSKYLWKRTHGDLINLSVDDNIHAWNVDIFKVGENDMPFWAYDQSKGLQGCRPRERPKSHITCSRECKECEGMNLHTPKWTPMLGVGVPKGFLNL